MKKMKVNAQVTAATTVMEAFGNVIFMVISFGTTFFGYGNLFQFIILYFVLLPYTHLMNTRINKDRVIEDGWQKVLKTVFRIRICGREFPSADNEIELMPQPDDQSTLGNILRTTKVKRGIHGTTFSKPPSNDSNSYDIQISTIFRKQQLGSPVHENINMLTLNVPIDDQQPCSSKPRIESVGSSFSSDGDELPHTNNLMELRYEIITALLESVTDENLYCNYLKQFIEFEEAVKKGEDIWKMFSMKKGEKQKRSKNSVQNLVRSNEIILCTKLLCGIDKEGSDQFISLTFLGNLQDRIKMRKTMIIHLLTHYNNDENLYDEFVERFINMEEDLVA